jgi:4-aminobutyrate aminotransferase-like enzyme
MIRAIGVMFAMPIISDLKKSNGNMAKEIAVKVNCNNLRMPRIGDFHNYIKIIYLINVKKLKQ